MTLQPLFPPLTTTEWYWADGVNKDMWKPFNSLLNAQLTALAIDSTLTFTHGNTTYTLLKTSDTAGVQTNDKTTFQRPLQVFISTVQPPPSKIPIPDSEITVLWKYKQKSGIYLPFDIQTSSQIEQLPLNSTLQYTDAGQSYTITKLDATKAEMINNQTLHASALISVLQTNKYDIQCIKQKHLSSNCSVSTWQWKDTNDWKDFNQITNDKINELTPDNHSFQSTFGSKTYTIKRLSEITGEQINNQTKYPRDIRLFTKTSVDWHWEEDDHTFHAYDTLVSLSMDQLQIGCSLTFNPQNITNTDTHTFYKHSNITGYQINIHSEKERLVIKGDGLFSNYQTQWMYKGTNGYFQEVVAEINTCMIHLPIGSSTVVSRDGSWKYKVKKQSTTHGTEVDMNAGNNNSSVRLRTKQSLAKREIYSRRKARKSKSLTYANVRQMFAGTCSHMIADVSAVTGQQIQYEASVEAACKRLHKSRAVVEKWLWHGTSKVSAMTIIKNGFDRSYNTTAQYGKGTYFARDASYSGQSQYSPAHTDGYRYMLLCRVIVGESIVGTNSMHKMPLKSDGTEYDTMVNNLSVPTIFVVWRDFTAAPAFLIKFK